MVRFQYYALATTTVMYLFFIVKKTYLLFSIESNSLDEMQEKYPDMPIHLYYQLLYLDFVIPPNMRDPAAKGLFLLLAEALQFVGDQGLLNLTV